MSEKQEKGIPKKPLREGYEPVRLPTPPGGQTPAPPPPKPQAPPSKPPAPKR
jgi:hypothetical protein